MKSNKIFKPVSISIYLAITMSVLIILVALLFIVYTLFNLKNLTSAYESEIYRLRYSISALLVQSLIIDSRKNEFSSTKEMMEQLKTEKLLEYSFVENNKTKKVIIGEDSKPTYERIIQNKGQDDVQVLSKDIGKYTVYFGIQKNNNIEYYTSTFLRMIFNILIIVVMIGILASVLMSRILAKPLQSVSNAAKTISDGDFSISLGITPFAEINDLIFSYNQMGFQLSELYSSLELKVQERTIALENMNHKLQETQAMMVHSEKMRSLGELVAGIAHEINNPVNFIHGNIMILKNYVEDLMSLIDLYDECCINLPQELKDKINKLKEDIDLEFLKTDVNDLLKSCKEGTDRTKNIILDLKNFSRMEEMVLTQFDIPKEIDTTLNILNNKIKNRITVVKNYSQDLPKIEAYGGQLNQVFMNILDNAQDAIKDTGTITINVYSVDEKVKIEFIDTGAGIAQDNISKVFDPFFTTKPVGKGTGLGMSISYRVIKDHNGTIEIDSKVGEGTKFTITLPIVHVNNSKNNADENLVD